MVDINKSWPATIAVAVAVCLVCAIFVCLAAVNLRELQDANILADKQRNILQAAALYREGVPIAEQFKRVEARVVSLNTGEYVNTDPQSYDALKASKSFDEKQSSSFSQLGVEDNIKIGRRENYAVVYLVTNGSSIDKVILPIRGYGLWSTMYGFIALESDGSTVAGLGFYDQKETPGLGGEVDNPDWKASWRGKKIYDGILSDGGSIALAVVKGKSQVQGSLATHRVDGLSGATITTKGVHNLIRFWLGEHGFQKYLERIQQQNLVISYEN